MGNEISTASCWGTANESPKASALMMMTTTETTTTTTNHKKKKKKLLFGCQTDEEHDEYVKEVCSAIATKRGKDGLSILGLEFHKWHNPKTCTCHLPSSSSSSPSSSSQKDKEEEELERQQQQRQQRQKTTRAYYRRDVSSLSRDNDDDDDDDSISNDGDNNNNNDDDDSSVNEKNIMNFRHNRFVDTTKAYEVPIGEPISRDNSMADLHQAISFGTRIGSERSASTAYTMFSLATHHSYISGGGGSSTSDGGDGGDGDYYGSGGGGSDNNFETSCCSIRLFHKSTNTCLTEKNHEFFIAHGKMYDEVARLCMEYAQDVMIMEGELEWQHVGDGVGALVSRNRRRQKNNNNKKQQPPPPVLLIVTGKGKVGAGIFSRRHLMTSGLEVSTALPFIRGANERGMNVIMLDPNVNGTQKAMKVVQSSLEKLFFEEEEEEEEKKVDTTITNTTNTCTAKEDLYILAHSMAGSQLTRFLHDNTYIKKDDYDNNNPRSSSSSSSSSPTAAAAQPRIIPNNNNNNNNIKAGKDFLRQIKAVSFTDSNHNINWTKNNPPVTELLVGEASLYIKSHKQHEEKKHLGEKHHDCQFWKHRFGSIKTIWGGTSEHALTNYTGRDYIWDHFDTFLDDE